MGSLRYGTALAPSSPASLAPGSVVPARACLARKELAVTLLQAWLFIGIPAAALGLAMFLGPSRWRPIVGYVLLLVGFVGMGAFHAPSGALFGLLIALLYAAGRGGSGEQRVSPLSATGLAAAEAADRARTHDPTAPPGGQPPDEVAGDQGRAPTR